MGTSRYDIIQSKIRQDFENLNRKHFQGKLKIAISARGLPLCFVIEIAERAMENGDYQTAEIAVSEAVAKGENDPLLSELKIRILAHRGMISKAKEELDAALLRWDRDYLSDLRLKLSVASPAFTASPTLQHAIKLMEEERWGEAVSSLICDISANQRDAWNRVYLGVCHYEMRQYAEAMKCFQQAESLAPNWPAPIGLQGDGAHARGDYDDARRLYLSALSMDPDDELALKNWNRFQSIEKSRQRS